MEKLTKDLLTQYLMGNNTKKVTIRGDKIYCDGRYWAHCDDISLLVKEENLGNIIPVALYNAHRLLMSYKK
jgi:hypothetical protein